MINLIKLEKEKLQDKDCKIGFNIFLEKKIIISKILMFIFSS